MNIYEIDGHVYEVRQWKGWSSDQLEWLEAAIKTHGEIPTGILFGCYICHRPGKTLILTPEELEEKSRLITLQSIAEAQIVEGRAIKALAVDAAREIDKLKVVSPKAPQACETARAEPIANECSSCCMGQHSCGMSPSGCAGPYSLATEPTAPESSERREMIKQVFVTNYHAYIKGDHAPGDFVDDIAIAVNACLEMLDGVKWAGPANPQTK